MDFSSRPEQERVRFEKLQKLRANSYPYPNDVKVTHNTAQVADAPVEEPAKAARFSLAGRIVQLRQMGKASFVHILDGAGKLQLYVRKDDIGEAAYEAFKDFDIGDIIFVTGYAFVTKTGEKSLHAESVRLLVKSLIPLPEKWHGLQDVEARYRQRYVDLIANPEARDIFRKRAKILKLIRNFLDAKNFLEVETPKLEFKSGGANAKPFKTFYNALGCDYFLRIALELPLKKLVVGGLERVYEIGPVFRNEGIDRKHSPEYTSLEFYQAYATFEDLMKLTEELLVHLAVEVCGSTTVPFGDLRINFAGPWPRMSMLESVHQIGEVSRDFNLDTLEGVQAAAKAHKVHLDEPKDWGRSLVSLWDELVEHKLIQPIFITSHPFSVSPLARKNDKDPKITDRFEIFAAGMELGNAFSELNDPIDQRERFEDQARRKEGGDEEASDLDEDFLRALEYGLPPTAGEGLGVERIIMLLTNQQNLRDIILFPQMKPLEEQGGEETEPLA